MREWTRRQAPLLAVLVGTIVVAGAIALATSGASTLALLRPAGHVAAPESAPTPLFTMAPTPVPTPTPLSRPGQLKAPVALVVTGSTVVAGERDRAFVVSGSGATAIAAPSGSQGVVVAAKDPSRVVAGGGAVQYSDDGGKTWKKPRTAPPGSGPYVALLVNPDDPDVWFFQHGAKLLRTRDAGVSWRELTGLPALAAPRMVPGAKTDEEILFDGTAAAVLDDNGQQLSIRTGAPAAVRSAAVIGTDVYAGLADGHLYRSTGTAWVPVSGTALAGPLAGFGGRVWVGDGGGTLGKAGAVASSGDGSAWAAASGLPFDQPVVALGSDRTGSVVVAYCLGGDLYRSSDGGKTFTRFSTALRG